MASDRLITIQQLAQETQLPISWLYERSRRDQLPGMRRMGKYVRVNRDEFLAALKAGKIR
jgi:predicted DNA-binding transcriptional regulator AlpA